MSAAGGTQSLSGLLNIPSVVVEILSGLLDIHWLKILPFLSGLKTKVRLRRPNFIRTQNIPLRGLSGVLDPAEGRKKIVTTQILPVMAEVVDDVLQCPKGLQMVLLEFKMRLSYRS